MPLEGGVCSYRPRNHASRITVPTVGHTPTYLPSTSLTFKAAQALKEAFEKVDAVAVNALVDDDVSGVAAHEDRS